MALVQDFPFFINPLDDEPLDGYLVIYNDRSRLHEDYRVPIKRGWPVRRNNLPHFGHFCSVFDKNNLRLYDFEDFYVNGFSWYLDKLKEAEAKINGAITAKNGQKLEVRIITSPRTVLTPFSLSIQPGQDNGLRKRAGVEIAEDTIFYGKSSPYNDDVEHFFLGEAKKYRIQEDPFENETPYTKEEFEDILYNDRLYGYSSEHNLLNIDALRQIFSDQEDCGKVFIGAVNLGYCLYNIYFSAEDSSVLESEDIGEGKIEIRLIHLPVEPKNASNVSKGWIGDMRIRIFDWEAPFNTSTATIKPNSFFSVIADGYYYVSNVFRSRHAPEKHKLDKSRLFYKDKNGIIYVMGSQEFDVFSG